MLFQDVFDIEAGFEETELEILVRKAHKLGIDVPVRIKKRSIDARQSRIKIIVSSEIKEITPDVDFRYGDVSQGNPVVIVGAGPGGLFAALRSIELGLKPIVLERGKNVRDRRRDLAAINRNLSVNEESNYCFGEGGAGTYSDGKLYTRSKKRGSIDRILQIFVRNGATREILYDAHPHIGTNKLPKVVSNISEAILSFGGEIHFNTKFSHFLLENNKVRGVATSEGKEIACQAVILATGHSARDIFTYLYAAKIEIEQKAFAIGVRIEHPQSFINTNQYKGKFMDLLPPAAYSINTQIPFGTTNKGVFSFCMCPGGFIVPASTSRGELVVNGMSPSRRDSKYANSGLVVSVDSADFGSKAPLAGLHYQQKLEAMAYEAGGKDVQVAPAQLVQDFIKGKVSANLNDTSYQPGLHPTKLSEYLPPEIAVPLEKALPIFDKQIKGYAGALGQVIGLESRTSSPVRIPRNPDTLMHPQIMGLFPCGEGAGYAGGILSAAMDGERCAEAVLKFVKS